MKRALPLLVAGILAAVISFADTSFLGNILQLHSQAEPLPTATNYTGSLVYNTTQSKVYWSNGTAWAELGATAAADGIWIDAGTGGITPANAPQVRVGGPSVPTYSGMTPGGVNFNSTKFLITMDGGMGPVIYNMRTRTGVASLAYGNAQPNTDWWGPNLMLITDRPTNSMDYSQIAFATRGDSVVTAPAAITYGIGNLGGAFSLGASGAMLLEASPGAWGVTVGDNWSAWPSFGLDSSSRALLGVNSGAPDTNSRFTIHPSINTTAIFIRGTPNYLIRPEDNGADLDLGTGTYDYFDSNGTRITQGGLGGGGLNVTNLRVGGNTDATTTVTSTTMGSGGIGFNQASKTHYMAATGREYRPILSGADWVHDGRTFETETTYERTACPIARKTLAQTSASGTDVTVFCADSASGSASVGTGHPARAYRDFVTTAASGQRSIFGGFTTSAPASGAGATPQVFVERQGGFILTFALKTGAANWTSNVTWYAGLFTTIPTSGSPYGNSVYLRFDTNNPLPASTPDTRFRLCACNGGTCTCSNLSVAPAVSTEYLFEIDCRESSTTCYAYMNGGYETSVATNLPALATPMGFAFAIENVDAAARTAGLGKVRIRLE